MELKEFVRETLMQIAAGIEQAQKALKEQGSTAIVNTNITKTTDNILVTGGRRKTVEYVEFDVAVLASEGTNTKAGVGITVMSVIKLDAGGASARSSGSESRIRFRVPMTYPMHKYEQEREGLNKS